MRDRQGVEIQVGQTVAFASRRGNTADLRTGVVTALDMNVWGGDVTILSDKKHVCHRGPNQVAVVVD